ncbi:MAG: YHS domain-containing protein [Hyphomicrobiaceae bacterium]|nr:YHS domain-containing protein [Hyphomicrobiaceae bacterium]
MKRRTALIGMGLGGAALVMPRVVFAKTPEVYANSSNQLFNEGFDPVGYFTDGTKVPGDAAIATTYKGAIVQFASEANRETFLADPDTYFPRYGGYCAFAMAHNAIATTVPEAWSIHNGRLYLNFSLGVREEWRKDPDGYIEKADMYWPAILDR